MYLFKDVWIYFILLYLDTYKEAAIKEGQLFYSASASEPKCPSNHNIITPLSQKKEHITKRHYRMIVTAVSKKYLMDSLT